MKSQKEIARERLLGMPYGTACAKLRKSILFDLVVRCGLNICFRCKEAIDTVADLSIEHKDSWFLSQDPLAAFFSLENISFSHHGCNCGAIARPLRKFASKEESLAAQRAHKKATHSNTPEGRRERYLRTGN